jgi:flavin-dependent dehydrogenase
MADSYDLIVIGAGPGGCTAAKFAAEKKLKVLLLERAKEPGDKNMSGSYLFRPICEECFPGFKDAECHKGMPRWGGIDFRWALDNDEKVYGMYMGPGSDCMRDQYSVFRDETDKWFTNQAVKAGAELKTALATDVIWENKGTEHARVIGVVTDKGNFEAPVTIDASGLHSIIANRAGLAKWHKNKIMLGLKYIYKLDPEVLRARMRPYKDTDGVDVDWGVAPMLCGSNPDHFGCHATGMPDRGIISIAYYWSLSEGIEYRVNVHQRAQWYLQQPQVQALIEGAEFVQCNFHGLAAGDLVGYVSKSYLPGLMLVGDAGGFSQPVDNYGANVAMWLGRLAAECAAEMKAKKDYSEAMFAKYEETWRDSWVGEDDVHEICVWLRDGSMHETFWTIDDVVDSTFRKKWNNVSYPAIILSAMPKLLNAIPIMQTGSYALKQVTKVGLKKVSPLLQLLGVDTNR